MEQTFLEIHNASSLLGYCFGNTSKTQSFQGQKDELMDHTRHFIKNHDLKL